MLDATLIAAPTSTKNASGERDPEMKQCKKGQQWFFGMLAHIGVDAESGLVHTVRGTGGQVNDVVEANSLSEGLSERFDVCRRKCRHPTACRQAEGCGQ